MNDKIALLTCFLDNCGACLQAYALADRIERFSSKQCEIINYTEPTGYFDYGFSDRVKESKPYLKLRGSLQKSYLDSYNTEKVRRSSFRAFREKYLPIGKTEYKTYAALEGAELDYSHYVCGSDQVWNPTFYGKCNPAYYLAFAPEGVTKTAYAPSIGIDDLPDYAREDFKKYLSRIENISVREDRGKELVKKYANRDAEWVCDPTMLLTGAEWEKLSAPRLHKNPYIFCYLFGDSPKYKDAIAHLSKETGLDVLIIPFSKRDLAKEYRQILKAGPSEFISLIKNAEYILTDSFHASVFSVLFKKNFFTLLRHKAGEVGGMNSRIFSLLKMLGLESRCVSSDALDNFPITAVENYGEVYERLNTVRKDSEDFLKNALGNDAKPRLCSEKECTGCGACKEICPKNAITLKSKDRGFLYPEIDGEICVNCKMCERVCHSFIDVTPILNQTEKYFAYQSSKDICMKSASGGISHELAKEAISQGFSVCGAVFSEDFSSVKFAVAETEAEIEAFRGSKYVAVDMGDIYKKVYDILKDSRNVLFFGLPCHIGGLKAYLKNKGPADGELFTVDLICHGVGSPRIWNFALDCFFESQGKSRNQLENVNFRSKPETVGKKLLLELDGKKHYLSPKEFPYYYGFENRYIMRNSCYTCKYRSSQRAGDITVGDMIPIDSEGMGRSVVSLNTQKGAELFNTLSYEAVALTAEEIAALKKRLESAHLGVEPKYRCKINPQTQEEFKKLSKTYLNPAYVPFKYKIIRIIKKFIKR